MKKALGEDETFIFTAETQRAQSFYYFFLLSAERTESRNLTLYDHKI